MKTKEEVIKELKSLQDYGDTEINHIKADELLCEFLTYLGYKDVVDEYEKIHKWYA